MLSFIRYRFRRVYTLQDPLTEILERFFDPNGTITDTTAMEDFKCEYVALHFFSLTNFSLKYFIDVDYEIPQATFEVIETEKAWTKRGTEILAQILNLQQKERDSFLDIFRVHCQPRNPGDWKYLFERYECNPLLQKRILLYMKYSCSNLPWLATVFNGLNNKLIKITYI